MLENKITEILELLKSKDLQICFSSKNLDKITTQLCKLSSGKNTNQSSIKFILAKPRK